MCCRRGKQIQSGEFVGGEKKRKLMSLKRNDLVLPKYEWWKRHPSIKEKHKQICYQDTWRVWAWHKSPQTHFNTTHLQNKHTCTHTSDIQAERCVTPGGKRSFRICWKHTWNRPVGASVELPVSQQHLACSICTES